MCDWIALVRWTKGAFSESVCKTGLNDEMRPSLRTQGERTFKAREKLGGKH